MTRILIADDHPLFRNALAAAVTRVNPGADIDEADTLKDAMAHLAPPPDLMLLDLHMADSEGFAGLLSIRHDYPALPVLIVSASESADVVARALSFGAVGFLPKSSELDTICKAIETVMAGDIWAPDVAQAPEDGRLARIASLTPAQVRVLMGMREGRLNKQIAYDMGITEATVKAHVTAVFRKLEVINRTQAVLVAEALDVDRPHVQDA